MLTSRYQRLLSAASGVCLPLAFAPFELFPVAIICVAMLFRLWFNATPRQAFTLGWLFGLGYFGAGVSWVFVSMHDFSQMHAALAIGLTAVLIAGLALFPACVGALVRRFPAKQPAIQLLLVMPAWWLVFEWLREVLFTGFPWLLLGYSQIDTSLSGFAPVTGVYGLSGITAATAGLLALIGQVSIRMYALATLPMIVLWICGALLSAVSWVTPVNGLQNVALLQGNIPQDIKWKREQLPKTLSLYQRMTLDNLDHDLIIWPEAAITAYSSRIHPSYFSRLAVHAKRSNTTILAGVPVLKPDGTRYNAVMRISENPTFYYKRHLVPFGEYIPLYDVIGGFLNILDIPLSNFSTGNADQPLLTSNGTQFGLSICYEAAYGEEIRRALPNANALVNVSNDAWFGNSLAPHQHLQIIRMRALETGRYVLRATNTGISAIINHKGEIEARSEQFHEQVVRGPFQPFSGATPFVHWGNLPVVIFAVCMGLTTIGRTMRMNTINPPL